MSSQPFVTDTKASEIASFGPFHLAAVERLLFRDDGPVEIGGRALDLLIALIARAGQVVSRWELMDLVWTAGSVEEATLRMHLTALRRALGEGRDGARYIVNVPGRGYSFVAPIQRSQRQGIPTPSSVVRHSRLQSLPSSLQLPIGRNQTIAALSSLVLSRRFVSIIGPGGIGKTTVAVAVAHALYQDFGDDGVCFVDLSSLADPAVVVGAVASAAGCIVQGSAPEQSLLAFLADRRMLIVLDSCEHVIKTIATLTERLFAGAPSVHFLTTSREALRVEGEGVHLLAPLDSPPDDAPSAVQALASPAVQLFMESAAASGYAAGLSDSDAPIVAGICRRLDGIALAIELAASRVGTYGIQGTADLLDNGAGLFLQGRRSARPRHQTLQAMLDWSCNLLSADEQRLLCKLSVFVGQFTLEAAQSVAGEIDDDAHAVSNGVLSLVDKSLISISPASGPAYFRLLDTTRAYAAVKLQETGEADAVARRHAGYFAAFFKSPDETSTPDLGLAAPDARHMGNIRKALAWSFSASGDLAGGIELTSRTAPLFLALSLYAECEQWCRRALNAQREEDRGTRSELELQEALAISSMWTRGVSEEVKAAIDRGLQLSEALRDVWRQIHFLVGLNILLVRLGDFGGAVAAAKRSASVARDSPGLAEKVVADWMLGASYHFAGDLTASVHHCERGFRLELDAAPVPVNLFGFDQRVRARVALARSLWLLGKLDQGRKVARQAIGEVADERPISHCIALLYCIPVFIWTGDLAEAAELVELAISKALKYSLAPYHALGLSLKGELLIAAGDAGSGVDILKEALKVMQAHGHHIVTPAASCALAEGLARCGRVDEALGIIGEALAHAEKINEIFWLPDLFRVRGEILLALPQPEFVAAEDALSRSIDCAREQSALSWWLRAAIPLARMWAARGRSQDARTMLDDIYRQFTEGFATRDLVAVRQLLDELNDRIRHPAT